MFASTELGLAASLLNSNEKNLKPHANKTKHSILATPKDYFYFFYNSDTSSDIKTKAAQDFLQHYIADLNLDALSWLQEPNGIDDYFYQQMQSTSKKFQSYLQKRKTHTRQYFPTVSHAFEFLVKVAPVKYVDGSWLYSTLAQWQSKDYQDLIFIYLEELGLGEIKANHVNMYQQLLASYELDSFVESLNPKYYEQAAIQLALAYITEEDLAWVIGFNLAYEQLPLHLLITNHELTELGINAQYFNVHITIDNFHNGHAKRAIQAFKQNYAAAKDKALFIKKVKQGYLLNDIGMSSNDIIQQLDPEDFALQIFQNKAFIGQYIHNEKCKYLGQTINQWLSETEKVKSFLNVLIEYKMIILGEAVKNSRFWSMINQAEGKMFGVFSTTEKQIIKDWIQGSTLAQPIQVLKEPPIHHISDSSLFDKYQRQDLALNEELNQIKEFEQKIEFLRFYLSPDLHHSAAGLWATQKISQLLFPFQTQHL